MSSILNPQRIAELIDQMGATQRRAQQAQDLSSQIAQIASQQYQATQPLRDSIISSGTDFLSGTYNPAVSPAWAPGKLAAEQSYGNATNAIRQNIPRGGRLLSALTDADLNKAAALTSLGGSIGLDEYNKLYGTAMNVPGQTIAGLGTAASLDQTYALAMQNLAAQQSMADDAAKAGTLGSLGSGAGLIAGSYLGGPAMGMSK